MKILTVTANNRRRVFQVELRGRRLDLPYAVCRPAPIPGNGVARVWVDHELGNEGFSYRLASGSEGTVHVDHVLEYNRDPNYITDMLLYRLTLEAQRRLETSGLGTRAVIRRLGTSPAQFYRLLDQTNYRKSVRQMLSLLFILDCEVDFVVRPKKSA